MGGWCERDLVVDWSIVDEFLSVYGVSFRFVILRRGGKGGGVVYIYRGNFVAELGSCF